jgi:DNA replication and repair protein RecF
LLDDVFAELDRRRRTALATVAAAAEQVLITAAVPEDVPAELIGATLRVTTTGDPEHRISGFATERPVAGGDPPAAVAGDSPG